MEQGTRQGRIHWKPGPLNARHGNAAEEGRRLVVVRPWLIMHLRCEGGEAEKRDAVLQFGRRASTNGMP